MSTQVADDVEKMIGNFVSRDVDWEMEPTFDSIVGGVVAGLEKDVKCSRLENRIVKISVGVGSSFNTASSLEDTRRKDRKSSSCCCQGTGVQRL
jgi:hypothetical protein